MKLIKQKKTLPVGAVDTLLAKSTSDAEQMRRHGDLLPSSIRALIIGPSNSGKTNVMMSLLYEPNGLKFENVYVWSKSLYQPKYKLLSDILKLVPQVKYFPCSENASIVEPAKARKNSIFIFDDVICEHQKQIQAYFSMGRHSCVDSFYLCQSYAKIPKHLIRDNANLLVLFKQDGMNLKHIYEDHVTPDMSFNAFTSLCSECWRDRYGFLVINKDCDLNEGRYRKGFDTYVSAISTNDAIDKYN